MPFNGSGVFNRVMNWTNDSLAHIKIKSDRHDQEDDNFASGLSNTLTRDGQSQPTADIPMNGHKLVNLGAPTNPTDAATKGYSDGIRSFSTAVTLSGADPEARIGFVVPDVGFGARSTNNPTDTSNRFVWNDKPDLSGTDIMVLDDGGSLSVGGGNITFNAIPDAAKASWKAMLTGFAEIFSFNKATGLLSIFGTQASTAAGATIAPANQTTVLTLDPLGKMSIGQAIPTGSSSSLTTASSVTINGGGATAYNAYFDATNWRASAAGWGIVETMIPASGIYTMFRSTASAGAGGTLTLGSLPLLRFDPTTGVTFADLNYRFGNGSGTQNFQYQAPSIDCYKVAGSGNVRWLKSSDGSASGTGVIVLEALDDSGNKTLTGNLSLANGSGALMIFGLGGSGRVMQISPSWYWDWATANGDLTWRGASGQFHALLATGDIRISGSVATKSTAGQWVAPSDIRLKEVHGDYGHGLAELLKIQPVRYAYRSNPDAEVIGLIAQDIEATLPECVTLTTGEIDGEAVDDLRQFDPTPLQYVLVNAVKELTAKLDAANARIEALEAK